jgi:hypothetical protein
VRSGAAIMLVLAVILYLWALFTHAGFPLPEQAYRHPVRGDLIFVFFYVVGFSAVLGYIGGAIAGAMTGWVIKRRGGKRPTLRRSAIAAGLLGGVLVGGGPLLFLIDLFGYVVAEML